MQFEQLFETLSEIPAAWDMGLKQESAFALDLIERLKNAICEHSEINAQILMHISAINSSALSLASDICKLLESKKREELVFTRALTEKEGFIFLDFHKKCDLAKEFLAKEVKILKAEYAIVKTKSIAANRIFFC